MRTLVPSGTVDAKGRSLVVYSLDSLEDLSLAPVLVAGFGNPMKAAVKAACRQLEGKVFVTGTDDKKRVFACGSRAEVVSLGAVFDERLFSNVHAIVEAAGACGARTILLADRARSDSSLLRAVCAAKGLLLLGPMRGDKSLGFWVSLEPAEEGPDGNPDWRACPHCKLYHDARAVMADYGRCPTCGESYRLSSDERIAMVFDSGTFREWDAGVEEADPIGFPGFDGYIERARAGGARESVRTGFALIDGFPVATGIMEPGFMMGSLGYVAGERLARMVERATDRGLPVVIFTSSGGARMQEGLGSLMQMAKVSVALERHARAHLPYFSVVCDPTTGGVTASFAMQGDVILAEPGALIGFAGRRVIQGTIKQELPEDFQTAEFALSHGLVDAIVERRDLRRVLGLLLALHVRMDEEAPGASAVPEAAGVGAPGLADAAGPVGALDRAQAGQGAGPNADSNAGQGAGPNADSSGAQKGFAVSAEPSMRSDAAHLLARLPHLAAAKQRRDARKDTAWENVQLARNTHRPTARYYIEHLVDGFVELHGDRAYADDGAIIGGVGWIGEHAVTVIAEEKGSNLKERLKRNFGCPQPEGYRKARRLMQQAERFGRPIVCIVDTQGAFCGVEAEERGQGNAIAECLMELAGLTVPVVSAIVGEGGSGGALALALANRVVMQEHAVYSVLSPEGFASILWKDASRAPEAAAVMRMGAHDALSMGVVDAVLSEGPGPAHKNPEAAAAELVVGIQDALNELRVLSPDELREQRHRRFRGF